MTAPTPLGSRIWPKEPKEKLPANPNQRGSIHMVWRQHHEIKRRVFLGQSDAEVARAVGCAPSTVAKLRTSDIMQRELAILNAQADAVAVDAMALMKKEGPRNVAFLIEVRDGVLDADMKTRVGIAQDMLDRVGFGKIQKGVGLMFQAPVTPDMLSQAREAKRFRMEMEGKDEIPNVDFSTASVSTDVPATDASPTGGSERPRSGDECESG
jgi:hypothetical protein